MNLDDLVQKIADNRGGNHEDSHPSPHEIVSAAIRSSILSGVLFHNRRGRHFLARNFRDYFTVKDFMNHPVIVAIADGLFAEMNGTDNCTDFCIKWLKKLDECTDESARLLIEEMIRPEWYHALAHPTGLVIIGLVLYDDRKFENQKPEKILGAEMSEAEIVAEAIQIGTQRGILTRNSEGVYELEEGFLDCCGVKNAIGFERDFRDFVLKIRGQMEPRDRAHGFATLFLSIEKEDLEMLIADLLQHTKEAEELFALSHPIGLALVGLYLYDHPNL